MKFIFLLTLFPAVPAQASWSYFCDYVAEVVELKNVNGIEPQMTVKILRRKFKTMLVHRSTCKDAVGKIFAVGHSGDDEIDPPPELGSTFEFGIWTAGNHEGPNPLSTNFTWKNRKLTEVQ